jgi:GAF domain-containing protein
MSPDNRSVSPHRPSDGAGTDPSSRARQLQRSWAALQQVAILVARESSPEELFAAVAEQVARVVGVPHVGLVRYEPQRSVVVGRFSDDDDDPFPIGSHWPVDSPGAIATVRQTGRPARVEDYGQMTGEIAAVVRGAGMRAAVASPIVVGKRLWGAMVALSPRHEPFPEDTESRLTSFTELVATAIANAESRAALARLAEEQAALRRVAELVAGGNKPGDVFRAVSAEVGVLFGSDVSAIVRFEEDGTATVLGDLGGPHEAGERVSLDPGYVVHAVRETRRTSRFDTDDPSVADTSSIVHSLGIRSAVASPIVVEGELWGAITAASLDGPLAHAAEERLNEFTGLIATAIGNTQAREQVTTLAEEQAALRRVATLVARGISPAEIFAAVSAEVDRVFGLDPATVDVAVVGRFDPGPELVIVGISKSVEVGPIGSRWPPDDLYAPTNVFRTGRSARIRADDVLSARSQVAEFLRQSGYLSQVASPIVVEGRLWGAMLVTTGSELPPDSEERLAQFTELVATAIANAESRDALAKLAEEQAALRRVATLVAEGVPSAELFAGVTTEVAHVFSDGDPSLVASVVRFDPGPEIVLVGLSRTDEHEPLGARWAPKNLYVSTRVLRTGQSARVGESEVDALGGPDADVLRLRGFHYQVGCPVVVEGQLWGAMCLNSRQELPPDTDEHLESFTELVATAIANAESREARAVLTEEQAALRRVATLVARDAPSSEVIEAVAIEVGKLLDADITIVGRYDDDAFATAIGSWSSSPGGVPVGTRSAIGGRNVLTLVAESGKPARMDGYDDASGEAAEIARRFGWRSSIAAPIVVEGRMWGVMLVATQRQEPFRAGAEDRLAGFTDLVATAVANTEARKALERFAVEQAALRRVATLVAQGAPPQDLFDAVAEEIGRFLPASNVSMGRYESDDSVTSMASWSSDGPVFPPGVRWPIKGTNVAWMVLQTGRPARIDDFSAATDPIGVAVREAGYKSAIGSPIVVKGHLWGAISAASTEGPMPPGGEARLASFTELVATAIANAEGSAELAASRRRIVAASDGARRRIERDLHDGVQQQLVSLGLELGAMKADPPTGEPLKEQLASVTKDVGSVFDALVEIARGIHPAILSQGGLAAALKALARRSAVPVELHAQIDGPLADEVEVAAYFVAAEALTNAAKHARASVVQLDVTTDDRSLMLTVGDDGVGGADPAGGSGLIGLQDRVEALGGTIKIDSSAGTGTCVVVTLPIAMKPDQEIESLLRPPQ